MKRAVAVASGDGHWVQLMRLQPVFADPPVVWLSAHADFPKDVQGAPFHVVTDANLWNKWAPLKMFVQMGWLMLRIRPAVVLTTGATPGFAGVVFGRVVGARTIWVDSIANSETLSNSGARAGRWAHVWLTQWEHLARPEGPAHWGRFCEGRARHGHRRQAGAAPSEPAPNHARPMIFATVGAQLAFDRLVQAADAWAAAHPELEFFAQVGPTPTPPRHMPWAAFVGPAQADELVRRAELVVAHAGMGSLLTAMGSSKPILIMPREAALGEHRNDDQMATARWMAQRPGVSVAWDESEIGPRLDARAGILAAAPMPWHADTGFVGRLRAEVLVGLGR